jgi:hypothetical protein
MKRDDITDDVLSILTIDLSPTSPGIPTSGLFAMAGKLMVPLHICARKRLFTASADSLDLFAGEPRSHGECSYLS